MSLSKLVVPRPARRWLSNFVLDRIRDNFARAHAEVPRYELESRHIRNLVVLRDRVELLKRLPHSGIVAEVGVDHGDFSSVVLEHNQPRKLHLIDAWNSERYHQGLRDLVTKKFALEIAEGRIEINEGLSTGVGSSFENEYFDWVYIDTDHSYPLTKDELELFSRKVKPGGFVAGHDFVGGNWDRLVRYGVIEAVYEFCVTRNWEIAYLTTENRTPPSFALRKIIDPEDTTRG